MVKICYIRAIILYCPYFSKMWTKIVFFQKYAIMMHRGPWGTPGSLRGGGGRMGLRNGRLGAQKALISMAIINILGRDTDFSKIVAGALCLGMPMGADCTLTTLRYSILRATNPQMPVNRVFCAQGAPCAARKTEAWRLRAPGLGRAGPPPCPARERGSVGAV